MNEHTADAAEALIDGAALDREIAAGDPVTAFRRALRGAGEALRSRFDAGEAVALLVHQHAALIDQLLVRAWSLFIPAGNDGLALVAVGGYGRAELHPHSDIDVLIVLRDAQPALKDPLERLVGFLWDIGLQIGHSVRTLEECSQVAAADITVATTLMESRLLAGPEDLYQAMRRRVGPESIWPSREFFEAKWREQIARHHKYHETAHNLEPNVKEGPGGLRDIQMIGWVAKRHFGAQTLGDLVTHGFLTDSEYAELIAGQHFLWRVRYALHLMNGRREDRLLFDYQAALAQRFGYRDDGHRLAVEQFMKDYYQTIMALGRLNEMLLQLFQEAILYAGAPERVTAINRRFRVRNGFIEAANERVFRHYPFALLELFLLLQQRPELKGVRASTIRLIRDNRYLIDDDFRNDLRCRSLFLEIIRQPAGISRELQRMHRYGVLGAYIPAFGRIVGLMQYDLFHVYTVDEHILMVIRNLRRFSVAEHAHEFPLCSEIMQRVSKPEILYLAGMFHDIAKGSGRDHSEAGAQEAQAFCLHHDMSPYDARLTAWLVRHHLMMSMTAQRRDISDPAVIKKFAATVGDVEHLDYLYVLTVADIRGTNPGLWNSWKDALLVELYQSARRALLRGLGAPVDLEEHIADSQAQALEVLRRQAPVDEGRLQAFWERLDDDYFLLHSPAEIAWQAEAVATAEEPDLPLVRVREQTRRGASEVFIYARDQEDLFAITTKTLDQLGLNIVDARIVTTHSGYTLDTYIVLDEQGRPLRNAYRIDEVTSALKAALGRPYGDSMRATRRPPRQLKHFNIPTEVTFTADERGLHTVMEVIATDKPGLLSQIGQAMMECGVRLKNAKIATFGARVEDIFFITAKDNQPLVSQAVRQQLTEAIVRRLGDQQDAAAPLGAPQ